MELEKVFHFNLSVPFSPLVLEKDSFKIDTL